MVVSQMRGNAASYWSLFATTIDQKSSYSPVFAAMEQDVYRTCISFAKYL